MDLSTQVGKLNVWFMMSFPEELDAECLVNCEVCQKKTQVGKWSEIASPPAHLCLCLNRFTFNIEKVDFTKEKTPVKVDEGPWIGGYEYELYHTIIHTGKDASSGHYYAMGRRSEPTPSGDTSWYTINDSQIWESLIVYQDVSPLGVASQLRHPFWLAMLLKSWWKTMPMFSSCVASRLRGRLSCESLCHSLTMSKRRTENSEAPGQQENFEGFTASIVSCLWANLVRELRFKQGFCRMTFPATFPQIAE